MNLNVEYTLTSPHKENTHFYPHSMAILYCFCKFSHSLKLFMGAKTLSWHALFINIFFSISTGFNVFQGGPLAWFPRKIQKRYNWFRSMVWMKIRVTWLWLSCWCYLMLLLLLVVTVAAIGCDCCCYWLLLLLLFVVTFAAIGCYCCCFWLLLLILLVVTIATISCYCCCYWFLLLMQLVVTVDVIGCY